MQKKKRGFIEVDWNKIERVMKSNGLNQKDICDVMGYDDSWLSGVKTRGTMREADARHFKLVYGVDIEIHEEEARMLQDKQSASNTINVHIDTEKLGRAIGESLGRVLNESLSNIIDYDKITNAAYIAMGRALNGEGEPSRREKRKLE